MYENKIIGIWGLGKVGTAAAEFFTQKKATIIGMDSRQAHEHKKQIDFIPEDNKDTFFQQADYILASPGIDVRPYYERYKNKWITELDIFSEYWHKPIIAITGSVGKTTITHILNHLLQHYATKVAVGGNIGTPMLELIEQEADTALLEVSSFQLEHCTSFAPDVALWTNFVPNHLDRHTLEEYFLAKTHILAYQHEAQKAIVPFHVFTQLHTMYPNKQFLIMIDQAMAELEKNELIRKGNSLFCVEGNILCKYTAQGKREMLNMALLPTITFASNWIAICATLDSLGYEVTQIPTFASNITIPEHRMEKIIRGGITFYNDSKATTPTSTLSAIERLAGKKVWLFLGGLSKGIDRSLFIQKLPGKVERIYCFGLEAVVLQRWCADYTIPSSAYATLDEAFTTCMREKQEDEIILFSPSGSSYDLFKDYQERGTHFKQLITNYFQNMEDKK